MPFGEVGPIFNIGKKVRPKSYLISDPKLTRKWSKIRENKKLTIGLSWRSGDMTKERSKHYTRLDQWTRLLNFEKVRTISIQYSNIDDDLNSLKSDIRKRLYVPDVDMKNDIEALAAILINCDLVIGPATATTMLAGSLGQRTVCLIHRNDHFVKSVKPGEKCRHTWLENGEVHIFDKNNQELVINNIIDEIVRGENG
jgi:ADP-heptose:LPS heptosyltransferase